MQIIRTISDLRKIERKGSLGFVPTMGCLHTGHISLIEQAKKESDKVICSIFINRKQFLPHEDFNTYPRQEQEDLEKLKLAGVDYVFLPQEEEFYPSDFNFRVFADKNLTNCLCAISRPGFFDGVCLVLLKFSTLISPKKLFLGEKDYQQYLVVKKMARDLGWNINVISCPIIREKNGLAMSSRNKYLTKDQFEQAGLIYQTLIKTADNIKSHQDRENAIKSAKETLEKNNFTIDYLELRDNANLSLTTKETIATARLFCAVKFSGVRLIDNISLY